MHADAPQSERATGHISEASPMQAELALSLVHEAERCELVASLAPGARDFPAHPLAELFPLIEGQDFDELIADIKASGVREPVTLYAGQILDGRNRVRAAKAAGVATLEVARFKGSEAEACAFVISRNLMRRHLDVGQRAAVAAELANMVVGGKEVNSANLQNSPPISQAGAAALLNVSTRSVSTATKIKKADPKLLDRVKQGRLSLNAAKRQATKASKTPQAPKDAGAAVLTSGPKNTNIATPKLRPLDEILGDLRSLHEEIAQQFEIASGKLEGRSDRWIESEAGERAQAVEGALDSAAGSLAEAIDSLDALGQA